MLGAPEPVKKIGKYEVQRELGRGAMAVVYEAIDTAIERTVAIKVIAEGLLQGEEARRRFYQEARSAGRLSHENILVIYDLGEDGGHPFIAMEHLRGTDLRRQLDRDGPPSLQRTLDIAAQIGRGLEYAHQNGVIHRDIKPSNICLTQSGRVKIMDFGIAKLVSAEMTRTGQTLGTPYYMAPEQVQGAKIDGRADIFAFGVVLYELLTGVRPFEGSDMASVLYKVVFKPPPPLPEALPAVLKAVVERCLAKDPEQRYPDFSAVLVDLERLGREIAANEESQKTRVGLDRTVARTPAAAPPAATQRLARGAETPPPAAPPSLAPAAAAPLEPAAERAEPIELGPPDRQSRTRTALLIAGAAGILVVAAVAGLLLGRGEAPQRSADSNPGPTGAASTPPAVVPEPVEAGPAPDGAGAATDSQAAPEAGPTSPPAQPAAGPSQPTTVPTPKSKSPPPNPPRETAAPSPSAMLVRQVEEQAAAFRREVDPELAERTAPEDFGAAADLERQLLERARRGDAAVLGELPRLGQRFNRVQARALLSRLHDQVLEVKQDAAKAGAPGRASAQWSAAERLLQQAGELRSNGNLRAAGAALLQAEPLYREAAAEARAAAAAEAHARILASAQEALGRGDPDAALAALKTLPEAELKRPKTAELLAQIERLRRAAAPTTAAKETAPPAPASEPAPRAVAPEPDGAIPVSIRLANVVGVRRVTLFFGSLGTGVRPNRRIMKSVGDATYRTELDPKDIGSDGISYEIQVQTVNGSYIADRREIRPR